MKAKLFAAVALVLLPNLAYAGGGTGASSAGNGSPGGANSDASNGNTSVDAAGAYVDKGASYRAGMSGDSGSGASKEMKPRMENRKRLRERAAAGNQRR